jgi:xanthosine phosphorylase
MSVVPEVISARHCGLKVVAVAAITNLAEGLGM